MTFPCKIYFWNIDWEIFCEYTELENTFYLVMVSILSKFAFLIGPKRKTLIWLIDDVISSDNLPKVTHDDVIFVARHFLF